MHKSWTSGLLPVLLLSPDHIYVKWILIKIQYQGIFPQYLACRASETQERDQEIDRRGEGSIKGCMAAFCLIEKGKNILERHLIRWLISLYDWW